MVVQNKRDCEQYTEQELYAVNKYVIKHVVH